MTTALQTTEQVTFPPLTTADRSDAYESTAVQALVRVVKNSRDLLFDSHSFNKHEPALIANGWQVVEDVREAVLNPPRDTEN
jgi:hypothetical protein